MFNPIRVIDSRWETEKRWIVGKRQESRTKITTRKLTMAILPKGHDGQSDKPILEFQNGPTGFESYYLEDLTLEGERDFCICAGTPNRWPACYVDMPTVRQFVKEYKATLAIS